MDAMAGDVRNRFLVALVFTIPIVLWPMVGTKLLGTCLPLSRIVRRGTLHHSHACRF